MSKGVDYFSGKQIPNTKLEAEKYFRKLCSTDEKIDIRYIMSILRAHASIKLTKYPQINLIVEAVKDNDQEAFEFFLNYFNGRDGLIKKSLQTEEEFIQYLNNNKAKNCQKSFSALCYATYFEFQEMALKLIELGADCYSINDEGDYILHSTVRGGSLKVLMKLQSLGININQPNQNGITPFQLACIEGNLHIMKYLLKMNEFDGGKMIDINQPIESTKDSSLHLGIHSLEYAVVKYLLIQGANKQAKNSENKTPYEKALERKEELKQQLKEEQSEEGKQDIVIDIKKLDGIISLLGKISLLNRLKLQTKVGPTKGMNKYSLLLLVINSVGFIGLLFVIPYCDCLKVVSSIFVVIYIISFIFLFLTGKKDPGYIEKYGYKNYSEDEDNQKLTQKQIFINNFTSLLQYKEYEELCLECCIVKPLRSKHCDFCKKCISVMDHHCPFVKNCIGSKNHKYFFFMLVTQVVCQLFIFSTCIQSIIQLQEDGLQDEDSTQIIKAIPMILNETIAYVFVFILLIQFLITIPPLLFMSSGYTSLEMRYKGMINEQAKNDIDQNLPVTEIPNRTKSKQYQEQQQPSTSVSRAPSDLNIQNNIEQDNLSNSQTKSQNNSQIQETQTIYTTLSSQQRYHYQPKQSAFQNFIDMLFRNANNALYFGDKVLHTKIFTQCAEELVSQHSQKLSESIRDTFLQRAS